MGDIGHCEWCDRPIRFGQPYMPRIPFIGSWGGFVHQYCPPRLVGALSERDIEILDAEAEHPTWRAGEREAMAWARWRLTPTRHAQVLNQLLDTQAALAHDPHTVNRLRRIRDRFSKVRSRRQP